MKTNVILAAIFLAGFACATEANAQVLASETFDYADGNLVGNGDWVGYGSDQRNAVQVESGQAVISGTGIQDVNLPFRGPANDNFGTLYYSIEFSVDDLGQPVSGPTDDFEYFVTFYNGAGGDNLSARIDIVAPSGAGDFSVGIASDDGTADATWPMDLNYGTTYLAVVSYDQIDNFARLWINPVDESDFWIEGTNQDTTGDIVSAVALRQATSDSGETIRVDNLVVGTNFADVVPEIILGDINRDGRVNFLDISPFILLLSNGGEYQVEADIDLCGKVDFLDITPFIRLLTNQ